MTDRFTHLGVPAVETYLQQLVSQVGQTLEPLLPPQHWRSLLLIGGYGRGEGGVTTDDAGNPVPHNNLDLLLITRGLSAEQHAALKTKLDAALAPLAARSGIGLDLGLIDEARLRHSPALVMWYDARFGHKTILGDASWMPSQNQFRVEAIPAWDIQNLLINRGTLLLINQLLLERGLRSDLDRRTVLKHSMKAIIGYGDALLYAHGRYHWSYAEKQRRMCALESVSPQLRQLYDNAISFRFAPDYRPWTTSDLPCWHEALIRALEETHRRIAATPTWSGYIERTLSAALRPDGRALLRLARGRSVATAAGLSTRAQLGLRAGGGRTLLAATFPSVAYPHPDPQERALTQALLRASDSAPDRLLRAYLRAWRDHGDTNFGQVLQKLNLSMEDPA